MDCEDDPWDWSVNQVVDELCYKRTVWNVGWSNASLPDPTTFETILRENDIDGASLLSIKESELKEDLNIKPLGQRKSLIWGIRKMQRQSVKFAENATLHSPPASGYQSVYSHLSGFEAAHSPRPLSLGALPERIDPNTDTSTNAGAEARIRSADAHAPANSDLLHQDLSHACTLRPNEVIVESGGRKKRRLELRTDTKQKSPTRIIARAEEQGDLRAQLCGLRTGVPTFIGHKPLPVDALFFDKSYGQPISTAVDTSILLSPGKEEIFSSNRHVIGYQSYVNRKMIYFLQEAYKEHSDTEQVLYPYSESSTLGARSLILLKESDLGIIATREKALTLGAAEADQNDDRSPPGPDWDYLLTRWQNVPDGEEVLPKYGSSDDEDSAEIEELLQEVEKDASSELVKRKELGPEEISEVVDEQIALIISNWETRSRPALENKAFAVWNKGKTTRGRLSRLSECRQKIARSSGSLKKAREYMEGMIWKNDKELRPACRSLEAYVEDIEKAKWEISVLQRPTVPRPVILIRTRKRREVLSNSEDDCMDSDEEIVDDRGLIEDFLDIDEVEKMDLTAAHIKSQPPDMNSDDGTANDSSGKLEANSSGHVGDDDGKNVKHEPLPTPAETGNTKAADTVIDLTLSESDVPETPVKKIMNNFRKDADNLILRLDLDTLVEQYDRKRLINKLIRILPAEAYGLLRQYVVGDTITKNKKVAELSGDIKNVLLKTLGEDPDFSIIKQSIERLTELLHLYTCWFVPSHEYFCTDHEQTRIPLELPEIDSLVFKEVLDQIQKDGAADLRTFLHEVFRIFEANEKPICQINVIEEEGEGLEESDSILDTIATPNKKRKRKVAESEFAIEKRDNHRRRRREYDERKDRALRSLQTQSSGLNGDDVSLVPFVNLGKDEDEPEIHIDSSIKRRIQPHQVEGVTFMWREIVETSVEEDGCLLAHTMGLGKTMQVITFLLTLAQAIRSSNPKIRSQIPRRLDDMRILIICPPGLIPNWQDEFDTWCTATARDTLGKIRVLTAEDKLSERVAKLRRWYKECGILLVGYAFLRMMVLDKAAGKRSARFTEKEHAEIRRMLLKGPTLVIADEAHNMKNKNSDITQVAKQFRTKNRIALTGSPLSNHLEEYYCMVDWISPGYLGELVSFRANYIEPIQEGLYRGSSAHERRTALKKLEALKNMLEEKTHRREVTVLKGSLKPKVEFVMSIPLTHVQMEAYKAFVNTAKEGGDEKISNAGVWACDKYLTSLCNHPTIYYKKVKADEKEASKEAPKNKEAESSGGLPKKVLLDQVLDEFPTEDESVEGEVTIDQNSQIAAKHVASGVLAEVNELFDYVLSEPHAPRFSVKVNLLLQILKFSIEVDDKILVFSQNLSTLDFLEVVLDNARIRYIRLDGSTKMQARQNMMKDFNEKDEYDVFLISTKAGGVGFNLHGANRVVLFDFSYNPTWEEQAVGRVYRLGQQKPVFVYRLISAGTFEEELLNKAIFKIQLAYRVVEKKNLKNMAEKKSASLALPKESIPQDLTEHKGKDAAVLDRIVGAMEKGQELIHAITTTETLQAEPEDFLTEADLAEVAREVADERLRKTDPAKWQAQQLARAGLSSTAPGLNAYSYNPYRAVPMVPRSSTGGKAPVRTRTPSGAYTMGVPASPTTPTAKYSSHLPDGLRRPSSSPRIAPPQFSFQQNGNTHLGVRLPPPGTSSFEQNAFLQRAAQQQTGSPMQNGRPRNVREVIELLSDEESNRAIESETEPATSNKSGLFERTSRTGRYYGEDREGAAPK